MQNQENQVLKVKNGMLKEGKHQDMIREEQYDEEFDESSDQEI